MTTEPETKFYSHPTEGGYFILKQEPSFYAGREPEIYELTFHAGDGAIEQNPPSVTIYYRSKFGKPAQAAVNWKAMGSQPVAVASVYARVLSEAVGIAANLDHRGGKVLETAAGRKDFCGAWTEVEPVDGRWQERG